MTIDQVMNPNIATWGFNSLVAATSLVAVSASGAGISYFVKRAANFLAGARDEFRKDKLKRMQDDLMMARMKMENITAYAQLEDMRNQQRTGGSPEARTANT